MKLFFKKDLRLGQRRIANGKVRTMPSPQSINYSIFFLDICISYKMLHVAAVTPITNYLLYHNLIHLYNYIVISKCHTKQLMINFKKNSLVILEKKSYSSPNCCKSTHINKQKICKKYKLKLIICRRNGIFNLEHFLYLIKIWHMKSIKHLKENDLESRISEESFSYLISPFNTIKMLWLFLCT